LPNQLWVHKNHRIAFEAVRALRDRGVDLRLVCTGAAEDPREPEHPQALAAYVDENRLADRIHILGVVPRDDYVQLLRGADAVVQPSLFEGWSSTVEDARALGKRLLLSDLPVHREQSPDGSRFFEPHDSEALAALMAEAGADAVPEPEALERQSGRVRDYARTFVGIAREAVAAR
jgi:glycosyltransferase involved in cell wall biosynthesis